MASRDGTAPLVITDERTWSYAEMDRWVDRLARGLTAASLVAEIDQARGERNLSSAVRVWLLGEARRQQRA